ncbi:hypothetical protein [Limimaricola pyoseonensis]|uniref:Uncharacterized protein n=1 Tax=Limimaricola pyoseonensis TaxID=521013 RepID=A0A1G7CVD4_9RHOB|nr:hypothetical protein [Limimaricola pyoseonensis]SDE43193.1 hypothetical protein SAMN04488567_1657 [Limimaricola pyoseonensis]
MTRLIFLLILASGLVFAGWQAVTAIRDMRDRRALPARQEDAMPAPFRTIAYIVLLALMAGTATGILGAG